VFLKQATAKKQEVDSWIAGLNTKVESLAANSGALEERIQASFKEIREELALRENLVLDTLKELTTLKTKNLQRQADELRRTLDGIFTAISFAEALVQDGTHIDVLNQQKPVLQCLGGIFTSTQSPGVLESSSEISYFAETQPALTALRVLGKVESNEASAKSTISRDLLACHPVSRPYSFTITAVNQWGERLTFGRDPFLAKAVNTVSKEEHPLDVSDLNTGYYITRLTGVTPGDYEISVKIQGVHITGSPFVVNMIPRDYLNISGVTQKMLCVSSLINAPSLKGASEETQIPLDSSPKTTPFSRGFCLGPDNTFIFTDITTHGVYRALDLAQGSLLLSLVKQGYANGSFSSPKAVACSRDNQIYVADTHNHRIQVFALDGTFVNTFGVMGTTLGQFQHPSGLAFDTHGQLVVADMQNHRIQIFANGRYRGSFGSRGSGPACFVRPWGVAVNSRNEIIVADSGNNRIQMFDSSFKPLREFGSCGSLSGQFRCPSQIAVDRYDNVIVCDTNNSRVQIFDPTGRHIHSFSVKHPFGIDINDEGAIYVAEWTTGGSFISEY